MSLEAVYGRFYDSIVSQSWQKIIIKYVYRQTRARYPQKLLINISEKHRKMFCFYSAQCQYDFEFNCKNKPCGMATIYHPIQLKNYEAIRKLEKVGYIFNKIFKLTVITYNSIKNLNPIFYKNHIPKAMFITKILQ